jgi:hypothetical protein
MGREILFVRNFFFVQDPDPVRYGHRPDPAGAGAEAGLSLHRERHRQRILVTQVIVMVFIEPNRHTKYIITLAARFTTL